MDETLEHFTKKPDPNGTVPFIWPSRKGKTIEAKNIIRCQVLSERGVLKYKGTFRVKELFCIILWW